MNDIGVSARRLRFAVRLWLTDAPRIVVGAASTRLPGWISTNRATLDLTRREDWQRWFGRKPIRALLAEHVWEHLSPGDAALAVRLCFDHLAPGGRLRLAVPDGLHPDPGYVDSVRPGGTGAGADDHQVLYDYRSLGSLLGDAGFIVEPLEYFDEAGVFHQSPWDPADGMVVRSARFDPRNAGGKLAYTSVIADARKPDVS